MGTFERLIKKKIGNLVKLHQANPEIKDLIIVTAEDEDEIQVGDCKIQKK